MAFLTVCLAPTLQKTLCFPSFVSGTVNRSRNHRLDASGKGINVTRVLTQLGKNATHLTQLGGDMRSLFLSLCEQDGLSVELAESNSQIRFCYTLIKENALQESDVTELVEESETVTAGTEQRLMQKFDSLFDEQKLSSLIISGAKAAGFSDTLIPTMVHKAKEKGLRVILDIRGKDLIDSLKYKPDIIKPNLYEFAGTFAADLIKDNKFTAADKAEPHKRIKATMLDMCKEYGCRIILTDGVRKIRAAETDNYFEVDVKPAKIVNTIGSGDAFTAGLASALEDGAAFHDAIAEGIRCGALNTGLIKPGVIL